MSSRAKGITTERPKSFEPIRLAQQGKAKQWTGRNFRSTPFSQTPKTHLFNICHLFYCDQHTYLLRPAYLLTATSILTATGILTTTYCDQHTYCDLRPALRELTCTQTCNDNFTQHVFTDHTYLYTLNPERRKESAHL